MIIKNSSGTPDGMWSLAVYTWAILATQALLGGSSFAYASPAIQAKLNIPVLDAAAVVALITTVGGYITRKHKIGLKAPLPPEVK